MFFTNIMKSVVFSKPERIKPFFWNASHKMRTILSYSKVAKKQITFHKGKAL
jgi:hypothetical protein